MARTKARVVKTTRIVGVVALARELGVTREHLYRVVTGRVVSRRLAAKLRRRGIKCGAVAVPAGGAASASSQGK